MKDKEINFLKTLLHNCGYKPYVPNRAFVFSGDKQLMYYLEKWTKNGYWEYGVSLRTGWFSPEGIKHFTDLLKK